jgi:hypothetical protein
MLGNYGMMLLPNGIATLHYHFTPLWFSVFILIMLFASLALGVLLGVQRHGKEWD